MAGPAMLIPKWRATEIMKTKLHRALIAALLPASALLAPVGAQAEDLLDIYHMAAQSDPQLKAAAANLNAVTEGQQQAKSLYYPNISFGANITRNREETDAGSNSFFSSSTIYYNSQGYSLSLSQPIYRRDFLLQQDQSEALVSQAQAQYEAAAQALALKASQRYFDVLAAEDDLAFAVAEKEAISRQLEQTKQRFEVGLIAITDVHESQAAFDLAVASEIAARNQLAIAKEALREVTGELPSEVESLGEEMPLIGPEPARPDDWIARALEQNLDVLAAKAAVDAAREQMKLQQSNRSPAVDLVASHNYTDTGGLFGDRQSTSSAIGVQLSIPLYQGGAIPSRIRQAQAQLDQAKEGLEQQRRAVQRSTSEAFLNVQSNISRVKALKQALISTRSALDATEAGYEVGTRTTVDVLDARRNLYRAERDYARARYDYLLSTLALKQAAGMLMEEDLKQINAWLE